jgi:hypothetical protein
MCIFCGGEEPATTEDHVPAKAFFEDRKWPEGFVFPACKPCNDATRPDEQLIAFLAPLGDPEFDPEKNQVWKNLMTGIRNNHREVYSGLMMSTKEKRRALREYRGFRSHGLAIKDHPLVKIPGEPMNRAARRVGYKIGAALYFKNTNRALPERGACYVYFKTNIEMMTSGIEPEILELVPFRERLVREKRVLDGQVMIKVNHTEDGMAGAYLIRFRGGLTLIVFVVADREATNISGGPDDDRLSCFNPRTWRDKFLVES